MCLIHMNSEELKTRVNKYEYTTGFIGATGGWHYTQLEKFLVSDPDDIGYFDKNITDIDESGFYGSKINWKDKWIFDGCAGQVLNYTYCESRPIYGYAMVLPTGEKINNGLIIYNDLQNNIPVIGTGIAVPSGFDFSKLTVYNHNPFPQLEMWGT